MVEITACSPVVGASVTGLDLTQPLPHATMTALEHALLEHGVLVFPGQHLDPTTQVRFAERWGEPLVVPYLSEHAVPGQPAVLRVTNMGKAATLTENWHFDAAYFTDPPPLALLAAQLLPPVGGDTMWANQYAAYDALSPAFQRLLKGLRAAFTGTVVGDDGQRHDVAAYHPIVRTHPETGRKALASGRIESVPWIDGMTREESRPLLEFLYHHASRPEFVYRHHWGAGDVVLWDNRCLLHYAVHDFGEQERLMHRVTIIRPRPGPTGRPAGTRGGPSR